MSATTKNRGNFLADQYEAIDHIKEARELTEDIATNKTLDLQDSGKVFYVTADGATITLPATSLGATYTIVNGLPDGQAAVTISPAAADQIIGADITAADDKDIINTKSTAKYGDKIVLFGNGSTGWTIQKITGTWQREA